MMEKHTIVLLLLSVILAVNLFTLKTIVEGAQVPRRRPVAVQPPVEPQTPKPILKAPPVPMKQLKQQPVEQPVAVEQPAAQKKPEN